MSRGSVGAMMSAPCMHVRWVVVFTVHGGTRTSVWLMSGCCCCEVE
jgi:hypothetical protein